MESILSCPASRDVVAVREGHPFGEERAQYSRNGFPSPSGYRRSAGNDNFSIWIRSTLTLANAVNENLY